jgi:hypothetical protein
MIESGCYTQLGHQTEWNVIDVFDFVVSPSVAKLHRPCFDTFMEIDDGATAAYTL